MGRTEGPAITLYFHFGDPDISVGACMPFEGQLQGDEQVEVSDLPAIETVASTIHHGSFSGLPQAYDAIARWIEANHYRVSGPTRELNLQYERGGDQQNFITEVQFPIEKI
jgi:effector-binding domain-containing protein